MEPLILYKALPSDGTWRLVLAHDAQQRCFAGASVSAHRSDRFLFVQIDAATLQALERGAVDFRTAMAQHGAGVAFEAELAMPAADVATIERVTLRR